MVLRLISIRIIEVRARRFIGLNEFFSGFNAQRVPMPIEITNDGSRLIRSRLHFVSNLEIAGGCLGNKGSNSFPEARFGSLTRFVGIIAAAALQHSGPVEERQTKGSTEGNIFYAPKNGMLTKRCHGLNSMMFSH